MVSESPRDRLTPRTSVDARAGKIVYWHRELPPLNAEIMGEHIVEATSSRVPGPLAHHDQLWERCYQDLMTQTLRRLEQEVTRLGGTCAHVLNESVDAEHDEAKNEAWLRGRFTYMLYRQATSSR
jgi:hypothetical protein